MKLIFHHINYVSKNVDELNNFYKNILQMETVPESNFPRTDATNDIGYNGKIKFVTEGNMQMHLAEKDLDVAQKNKKHINPVEKGHIAFRTDDIENFKKLLKKNKIRFADYGTAFAKEWYQIFFYDPEGNIIEVHQLLEN
ncbi:MAG: glyoxalase [SAR116 cluster bacterium]|mgnify:FL=1|nr:glyoxalase [SAR116 cluster bacterium]